jgi:hypothetical protein
LQKYTPSKILMFAYLITVDLDSDGFLVFEKKRK